MSEPFANDREFNRLVKGSDTVDVVALMFEFARDAYPDLDVEASSAKIKQLGEEARHAIEASVANDSHVRGKLQVVSQVLYQEYGYRGNSQEYYDPRNSYLNDVLTRRRGLPITLGILYMAVAQRAGLRLYGVPTPGHFVLGCDDVETTFYIDPFSGGDVLSRESCRHRIERTLGQEGIVRDEHFRAATTLEIATRVLRNLKGAYANLQRWEEALPVAQRLNLLSFDVPEERRDLGLILLRVGRPLPALELLEEYIEGPGLSERESLEPYVRSARRMLAELN